MPRHLMIMVMMACLSGLVAGLLTGHALTADGSSAKPIDWATLPLRD